MQASLDRDWLLGEPWWWGPGSESPPDFRSGELAPPETWISSTPRIGNIGWIRQRLRPLAWGILRPMAWAPLFLAVTALPLYFPDRTPNDQAFALTSFLIAWTLVIMPLLFARNSQPLSTDSPFSLPLDWVSLFLALAIFPLHILLDSRIGWISYATFWLAYLRTVRLVQDSMQTPPARFLLPIEPSEWKKNMPEPWETLTQAWSRGEIAKVPCEDGHLVVAGASRSGHDFLSLSFVHKSGFVHDPFHVSKEGDTLLSSLLRNPPPIMGREWPGRFISFTEEE